MRWIMCLFSLLSASARVAWLRATDDPRALDHSRAVASMLKSLVKAGALQVALDQVLALTSHPFAVGEAAAVERQVRKFSAELLRK